ncbi:hypothetical protein SAMN05661096_00294 [Marivirga sericea]|uniref:Uncharacterized protein n=1 Tax=Marivirga sericea TaxID=1028 RepID=A0A1X7I6K9_9BACT|nr:hypothetical protein [Marivirga sericea]SMG10143.1 hypothetical protein SAMN05661096_00294 [Marivirga sericea]
MKLTKEQQDLLANHIAKKPIDYIELYNELYDHYASAYENSEGTFEETLEKLDEHFHYQKVKSINAGLLKKTKKSVNDIYWTEFKNFWRWPQIVTTLGLIILGFTLLQLVSIKLIMWSVVIPMLIFNAGIFLYGQYLGRKNEYGSKKYKSAHLYASQFYLTFPTSIFNLAVILPLMAGSPNTPGIHFFEQYPIIVLILMTLFLSSATIGLKVFKSKIKIQYL